MIAASSLSEMADCACCLLSTSTASLHICRGSMQMAKPGQKVSVRYRGTLAKNGKVFDETKGNKTFSFRLGEWATCSSDTWCPFHRLHGAL